MAEDNSVIIVQSPKERVKVVNRIDVLIFDTEEYVVPQNQTPSASDTSDDELVTIIPTSRISQHEDRPGTRKDRTATLLSHKRTKKHAGPVGRHSNPHHLPRSVFQQEQRAPTEYSYYSEAIIDLGRRFGFRNLMRL